MQQLLAVLRSPSLLTLPCVMLWSCRWGNVPRYVLQHAHDGPRQQRLETAIMRVSARNLLNAVWDYGAADEFTSKLLHIRVSCCRQGRQAVSNMRRGHSIPNAHFYSMVVEHSLQLGVVTLMPLPAVRWLRVAAGHA